MSHVIYVNCILLHFQAWKLALTKAYQGGKAIILYDIENNENNPCSVSKSLKILLIINERVEQIVQVLDLS